jgi:hypothetical protein
MGPRGHNGNQGPQGVQGNPGAGGKPGVEGPRGERGPQGAAGSCSIQVKRENSKTVSYNRFTVKHSKGFDWLFILIMLEIYFYFQEC